MDLSQQHVYCSVCYKRSGKQKTNNNRDDDQNQSRNQRRKSSSYTSNEEGQYSTKFWLTSCAHILCREHAGGRSLNEKDLKRLKMTCPACEVKDAAVIPIDSELPMELKTYFMPFASLNESFFAASQFQYCGLVGYISHLEGSISRLDDKIERQRQLLFAAKFEVSQVEHLKLKIKDLEEELTKLRGDNGHTNMVTSNSRRPTMELKRRNSFMKASDLETEDNNASFVAKIQKTTMNRKFPSSTVNVQSREERPSSTGNEAEIVSVSSMIGESTNYKEMPVDNSELQRRLSRSSFGIGRAAPLAISNSVNYGVNAIGTGRRRTSTIIGKRNDNPGSRYFTKGRSASVQSNAITTNITKQGGSMIFRRG